MINQTKIAFSDAQTFDKDGLKEYVTLAAPYVLMSFLDFLMWELMTITAGLISVDEQACQVLLINILAFCYMCGSGMQTTTCVLIGN